MPPLHLLHDCLSVYRRQHSPLCRPEGEEQQGQAAWKKNEVLVELRLLREVVKFGVANLPKRERAEPLSERGQGQMRYRPSMSPKK